MVRNIGIVILLSVGCLSIGRSNPDSLSFDHRYDGISGGLGVTFINVGDVIDFISSGTQTKQSRFATAGEFFGAIEIQIAEEWGLKLEYSSLENSYNIPVSPIIFSYSYNV